MEIEIAFFHSRGKPKGRTLDHFFYVSHIRHNFPYKLIPISMSVVEIFLKLSTKTVQVHLIILTTLEWTKGWKNGILGAGQKTAREKVTGSPLVVHKIV